MNLKFSYKVLNLYMYLPVAALLIGLYFVFFSEDKFRYECQDPALWNDAWCNPPLCLSVGACTSDLISIDGQTFNRYKEQIDLYTSTVNNEPESVVEEPVAEEVVPEVAEPEVPAESINPADIDTIIRENKVNE